MGKIAFGVKAIQMGDINATTGLPENLAAVGDVYKGTAVMTTADGTKTTHFSEFKQDPLVVVDEKGETTLAFSLMSMKPSDIVKVAGGTVTSVAAEKDVWNAPADIVELEKSFEIETKDGFKITINRGKVVAKMNATLQQQGISLWDVMVTVLTPNVDDTLPPFTVTDNVAQPA